MSFMTSRTATSAAQVTAYLLVALGAVLALLSGDGYYHDQSIAGANFCGTPLAYPICPQVSSQSGAYIGLIGIGMGLAILGIFLGFRSGRTRRRQR